MLEENVVTTSSSWKSVTMQKVQEVIGKATGGHAGPKLPTAKLGTALNAH